jgi:hypothetical protein
MATSDYEQRTVDVPQHKRIAQGEKLDGTAMEPKGGSKTSSEGKKSGGLSHASKKK